MKTCRKNLHQYSDEQKRCPECNKTNSNTKVYREQRKINSREWRKANPDKHNALQAKHKATKICATPKWLNQNQLNEIEEFYTLAQELQWLSNELLEVDHIIPLRGKDVSGLHVPWNLQILPSGLNKTKGNK
jgi:hypothetical protein